MPRKYAKPVLRGLLLVLSLTAESTSAQVDEFVGGGPEQSWVIRIEQPFGVGGDIYAGTYAGGIYRSRDGGLTWTEASSNARDAIVWDIDRAADGTLFAATEDRGVLRSSSPGGGFWQEVNSGLVDPQLPAVFEIETHPLDPLRIYAGTSRGTFRTRNQGNTWPDSLLTQPNFPLRNIHVFDEAPLSVYGVTKSELFVQAGTIGSGDYYPVPDFLRGGVQVSHNLFDLEPWPGTRDSLLVADFDGAIFQWIGGQQFARVGPQITSSPQPRYYRVRVNDREPAPAIYAASDLGLYCTHNRGQLWLRYDGGLGLAKPEIWEIEVIDAQNEEVLLGSFSRGILRGTVGGDWVESNTGLRAAWVRAVDASDGEILIGTAHGGIFTSNDGSSWNEVTGSLDDLQFSAVHRVRDRQRWLVSGFRGTWRSDDRGESWVAVALPEGVDRVERFVASPVDPTRIFAAVDEGLLRSDDAGSTWSLVESVSAGRPCFALAVSRDGQRVAMGLDPRPATSESPRLFVGDGDDQWSEVPAPAGARVRGLAWLDGAGESLLVASYPTASGILARIDGLDGEGPFPVTPIDVGAPGAVSFPSDLAAAANAVWLALDDGGVLLSDDGLQTWREWSEGLVSKRIEQIALDTSAETDRVVVGTFARGAWVREIAVGVAVAMDGPWLRFDGGDPWIEATLNAAASYRLWQQQGESRQRLGAGEGPGTIRARTAPVRGLEPLDFIVEFAFGSEWREVARLSRDPAELRPVATTRLLGAAPNPFNPRTSIRWVQSTAGVAKVELYDLRGRRVRSLFEGEAGTGRHTVPWDGTDDGGSAVASGNYLVRLDVDGRSWTTRVTLLR